MSAGGGPFVKLTIAGRPFKYTADATPSVKRGGFENAYEPNGDGTARQLKTRVTWAITGNKVEIDNSNDDFEFLNDTKDSATDYDIQPAAPSPRRPTPSRSAAPSRCTGRAPTRCSRGPPSTG